MIFGLLSFSMASLVQVSDVYMHPRIQDPSISQISNCIFAFLYYDSSGAAICIDSQSSSLSILDSCFRSCVISNNYGGSIFLNTSNPFITKRSIWEACYIHNRTDNLFGNTMCIQSPQIEIDTIASLACGPSREIAGDSTQHFITSKLSAQTMNNTDCSSYGGSSGFEIDGLTNTNENEASHINIINGSANHIILNYPRITNINIMNGNFKGTSNQLFHSLGLMKIVRCYIWSDGHSTIRNDPTLVVFDDCFGNVEDISPCSLDRSYSFRVREADFCGALNIRNTISSTNMKIKAVVSISLLVELSGASKVKERKKICSSKKLKFLV